MIVWSFVEIDYLKFHDLYIPHNSNLWNIFEEQAYINLEKKLT